MELKKVSDSLEPETFTCKVLKYYLKGKCLYSLLT